MPVPDTNAFSLQDVVDIMPGVQNSLQSCFDDSIDGLFDPLYKGSKTSLYNFRNYGGSMSMWFPIDGGGNGDVGYSNATWATCRGAATGDSVDTSGSFSIYADYTGGLYYIYRGFMRFDLSAIPVAAVIEAAGIGFDITTNYGANTTAYGYIGTQGDTLTTADFDAFTFDEYIFNNWTDTPDPPFDDYDVELEVVGSPQLQTIEDTFGGYLYIALINYAHDQSNSAPTDKQGIEIYRSGGSDDPPSLRIQFSI